MLLSSNVDLIFRVTQFKMFFIKYIFRGIFYRSSNKSSADWELYKQLEVRLGNIYRNMADSESACLLS